MKGIILAAGKGTRLRPITFSTSKILLPVYDKPMVYYPLSTLISMGVDEVMVITSPQDLEDFRQLLGDGSRFGISIVYQVQKVQRGIADAFIVAEDWISGGDCVLILGDNIFLGDLPEMPEFSGGAHALAIHVPDPWLFGIAETDGNGKVIALTEKPPRGEERSDLAVVGLYIFDGSASRRAGGLQPSARGELEITDLNTSYLREGRFSISVIGGGTRWFDAGSFDSLLEQSVAVKEMQGSSSRLFGSPEVTALEKGLIRPEELLGYIEDFKPNAYWNAVGEACGDRPRSRCGPGPRRRKPPLLEHFQ